MTVLGKGSFIMEIKPILKKQLSEHLRNSSFKNKVFLVSLAIEIVVIFFMSVVLTIYLKHENESQIKKNMDYFIEQAETSTNTLLTDMLRADSYVANDYIIVNSLYDLEFNDTISALERMEARENLQKNINSISFLSPKLTSIALFNKEPFYFYQSGLKEYSFPVIEEKLSRTTWYDSLLREDVRYSFFAPQPNPWDENGRITIACYTAIRPNINSSLGLCEVQMPFTEFENIYETLDQEHFSLQIFDRQGNLFYQSGDCNNIFFTVSSKNNIADWTFKLHNSKSSQFIFLRNLVLITAFFDILLVLLFVFYHKRTLSYFTKPLDSLIQNLKNVTAKNYTLPRSYNEFDVLTNAFNELFKDLQNSIHNIYQLELEQLHAQFESLQEKINPHFLYNSFACICSAAELQKTELVNDLCVSLSSLMRYSLTDSTDFVSLSKEVDNIKQYLYFMQLSQPSSLSYEIEADDKLFDIPVPKLIFQPLVENCFQHAFKNYIGDRKIFLTITLDSSGAVTILLQDNGVGFQEPSRQFLLQKAQEWNQTAHHAKEVKNMKLGGMGILNVFYRLSLAYRSACVLEIESEPQKGSSIRFCFVPISPTSH